MNFKPRVEFDINHYPRIRVWDSAAGHDRYIYLHRLSAYADGEIDSLWSEKHIHHINGDKWDNRPENLAAVDPAEHSRYHSARP